jgi:hypothetical protein
MPYKDVSTRKAYAKKHYGNNKAAYVSRAVAYGKKLREEALSLIFGLKDRPCSDCGGVFPSYCMDFDHAGAKKTGNISNMAKKVWSRRDIAKVIEEAKTCDVVCSNCHRIRTHFERKPAPATKLMEAVA